MRLFGPILVLTLIEIALFITVGGWLGLGLSLLVILGTAVLGSGLLRLQGQRMALDLRQAMNGIGDPLSPMAQRGLIMMAAILLILPGFLGDTLGLLLLLPPVRHMIIAMVGRRVQMHRPPMNDPHRHGVVIDADFVELDEPPSGPPPARRSGWTQD
ncbi:exclusion protein FxsA [Gemmobacter nanjingensis]|uniref:Exclusion protein FxsA n=1 Tax=Gemmobacter nanjingensis TaxID=488454 RepID=A0ABQ3FLY9_9RHOB|nr:FxsA family protein [Gemmobacter nanjingensis]GHC29567.1 exclusion protein FxsA [Gemmobacter nanjingensis]